jgi:uncharacterized membrane-anchored protein YitT (DUF2179 family)
MTGQVASAAHLHATTGKRKTVFDFPFHPEDFVMMVIGVIIIGFGLKGFIVPNKFFDGGTTGISLLIQQIYHLDLEYVIILVNIPLLIMGIYTINMNFAVKSLLCILALAVCLKFLPYPIITNDKLLIAIFGGFFLGLGIGFCMRAGCAFDGMEILALYTWKKTSFTITEIIMAINILIFTIAAFKFGIETSLYSMLTYFTATRTIDYVIEGWEAYTGVTIISSKSEEIKQKLVNEMRRGITVYKGKRGFLPGSFDVSYDCDIIFTIATRLEVRRLKNVIHSIDPKAFVYVSIIRETSGGIIKRKNMHH